MRKSQQRKTYLTFTYEKCQKEAHTHTQWETESHLQVPLRSYLKYCLLLSSLPQERYKADISLAIQLLQCKPDSFVPQKVSSVSISLSIYIPHTLYTNQEEPPPLLFFFFFFCFAASHRHSIEGVGLYATGDELTLGLGVQQ